MADMPKQISDLQDGDESSHGSEGPDSPLEDIASPHKPLSQQMGERIGSINCPESPASAVLSSKELWQLFDAIGTEMIVTRRGRRMFPAIKVELYDLKPDVSYILLMDMAPVDKYRYKYNAGWVRCFEEECAPTRLYIHPDSPALGSHWTSVVVNFYKLKLTNNQLDKQGHIIVNSMHRYQPRLHIVESDDINNFNWETRQTFIFPGTQFTTVTAYQNDKITQLKIQTNPFAKGFRTPFSRCRSRNPPGSCARFPLRSGSFSDSGVEDPPHPSPTSLPHSSPTSLFSPKLLLPSHDSSSHHIVLQDPARVIVQGRDVAVSPRVLLPGLDLQQVMMSELQETGQQKQQLLLLSNQDGNPILVQNGMSQVKPQETKCKVVLTGQNYQQKLIFPASSQKLSLVQQEADSTKLVVAQECPSVILPTSQSTGQDLPLGKTVLYQTQNGQKVGPAVLVAGSDSSQVVLLDTKDAVTARKRRQPPEENAPTRKVACIKGAQTSTESPVVMMYQSMVDSGQHRVIPAPLFSSSGGLSSVTSSNYTQSIPRPQVSTINSLTKSPLSRTSSSSQILTSTPSSTPTVVNGLVHLKSSHVTTSYISSTEMKKPAMDISCLTKEGALRNKAPPALVQVKSNKLKQELAVQYEQEKGLTAKEKQGTSRESVESETQQDIVLVHTTPLNNMQRVVVVGEKREISSQPQMILPVAYDQQLVSMPIYRVGSGVPGLKSVQVLASLPSGGTIS